MVYLDYSATTYVSDEVLKEFNRATKLYMGNPNSSHYLGTHAKMRINEATSNISRLLGVKQSEVIYTSGASEANNLAIKGICKANKGRHIITTMLEHSSVIAPINRLINEGYEVSIVKLKEDGTIDLDYLKSIIRDDTVLVCVTGVDSELGIKQNLEEIGMLISSYPNCYFHVDATQMIGKTRINFKYVDSVSFSAHKFFGIKGIGCLLKKENVRMIPMIDGGLSTTKFRSGTPTLELIVSLERAIMLAYQDFDKKLESIKKMNFEVKDFLKKYENIIINNTSSSIDQIINFSCKNAKKLVDMLNECGVYLSTKSACSSSDSLSKSIMALYNDESRAENSIRISLSYVTTKKEIKMFKKIFDICYKKLGDLDENNKI